MYKGHTVISTCPAGRKRYLSILARYLLKFRNIIDEHHWWVNTDDENDIDFLNSLCELDPDYFKLIPFPCAANDLKDRPNGSLTVHRFFTPEYKKQNVLYLRFDDDICYIDDDAVEKLLEFRFTHREYFLVFANIINNGIQDAIRQRMGLIDYAPFLCNYRGSSHKSALFAEANHWSFLRRFRENNLDDYRNAFKKWILANHERVSINCFAWWGHDMSLVEVPEDDEHFLTKVAPKATGRLNVVCGNSLVSHFAFYTQRAALEKTELLQIYENISNGKEITNPIASVHRYDVNNIKVCIFTANRAAQGKKNYIADTIANFAEATDASNYSGGVDVIIDGDASDWIGDLGFPIRTHPVPVTEWKVIKGWNVHRRISYSYHRSFQLALSDPNCHGVLICEDDIDFRPQFLNHLQEALDELSKDEKKWFTLSLYTVGNLDSRAEFDVGELYGIYPEWLFWGGQGVFFSRNCLEEAVEFWKQRGWHNTLVPDDANDRLIGKFGHSLLRKYGNHAGHYRTYRDLVQHLGEVTTGMSTFYHFSDTFDKPWIDYGEDDLEQSAHEFAIARSKNPENVALIKNKAIFIPLPKRGSDGLLRAFGRMAGLSVGGEANSYDVEYPVFRRELPDDWFTFTFVVHPLTRIINCYEDWKAAPHAASDFGLCAKIKPGTTFRDFVRRICELPSNERGEYLRPQSMMTKNKRISFVGKFENFEADFAIVKERLNIKDIWLPAFMYSDRNHSEYYDEYTLSLASSAYDEDIKEFGY